MIIVRWCKQCKDNCKLVECKKIFYLLQDIYMIMLLSNKQFSIKTFMKKQKRDLSFITKHKKQKLNLETKTPQPSQKKLTSFKQQQPLKENKSFAQDGSFLTKQAKNTHAKMKQRSKSLICNKKAAKPIINQFHHNTFFNPKLKKIDKEDTDFSAHVNSIKYDKPIFHVDPFHSNFLSCGHQFPEVCPEIKQNEDIVKMKQLQEENKTYRASILAIKEEMSLYLLENQTIKQENIGLKHRISAFQLEKQAQAHQIKVKEIQLTSKCKKQQKNLQNRIKNLQTDLQEMTKLRDESKQIIKRQQQNICQLQKDKQFLKQEYQKQKIQNCEMKRQKEVSKLKIIGLQQQIQHFSQNLSTFEGVKKTYEQKFSQLEKQKHRIKDNACQLLQIIQNYRNH